MVGRGRCGREGGMVRSRPTATTTKRVVMKSGDDGTVGAWQQGVAKKGTIESGDLHQWAVGGVRWWTDRERERKGDNHSKREREEREGGLL